MSARLRLLGLLAILFGLSDLAAQLAPLPWVSAAGESAITGLPRRAPPSAPAGTDDALERAEPRLRALLLPRALLLAAAAAALVVVGLLLRRGSARALALARAWCMFAFAVAAANVALTLVAAARLGAALGPLAHAPGLPPSAAPSSQVMALTIWLVLHLGWPIALLLLARPAPAR